jgi:serine/threonine-protein kinase
MDDGPGASANVVPRPEIDGYRLGDLIGKGTYSVVYSGTRIGSGQNVAIKVFTDAEDHVSRGRFARELEILGRLADHRYVVTVIDWGEVNGREWIAMERLSASLALDDGRPRQLDAGRVADVGVQVACALATMHGAGIVHRDIKPSNLLEGTDGLIKLADFGIAKDAVRRSKFDTLGPIGTEAYMAPEVLDGSRAADDRSDQYGLCATLVSLLLGVPCGADLQNSDVGSLRSRGTGAAPDDLLEALVGGLRRDPDERHGSMDELAQALEEVRRSHGWEGERYVAPMAMVGPDVQAPVDVRAEPLLSSPTLPPIAPSPITAWVPAQARDSGASIHAPNGRRANPLRSPPTWIAVGTAGALAVAALALWMVASRSSGVDGPPGASETTALRTAVVGPRTPTSVAAAVRDESAIDVVWDYPDNSARGFLAFVNGAEQPDELPPDARSTTLSGFIGDRRLCIQVAAIVETGLTERSRSSCVDARFQPSLPPAGTPPNDRAAAELQIRQAMTLIYDRSPRAPELTEDNTGITAAVARLDADAIVGPIAASATPEVGEIVFTSPAEAWFTYDLVTSASTIAGRFGTARLHPDAGWKISRTTVCQDIGLNPYIACDPDVVPVRPPQPPVGILDEAGSSPTIVNAIGGIVDLERLKPGEAEYSLVLVIDFLDRECDVNALVFGLDLAESQATEQATDAYCENGRGTLQTENLCIAGPSTQYVSLKDAAGNIGPQYSYEYECRLS